MNAIQRLLRGRRASGILGSLGIDSKRYWLLMDLFGELSERGEMLDQLGRNGVALQVAAWVYAAFSALVSLFLLAAGLSAAAYFSTFLILTALLLSTVLLSETGNSLVNPAEGVVLAHQPINGATYTAAKLAHLARIILYLVPAINGVPAVAGLLLNDSGWSYPFLHMLAALAAGTVAGLLCCALYGWLIRFVPARRLKAAGQLAGTMPFVAMVGWKPILDLLTRLKIRYLLPAQPAARWACAAALGAIAAAVVLLGIRSLSADYLIRVSSIMHGGRAAGAARRKSRIAGIVARLFGGQPARAGFLFVSRLARRDFEFRRQATPMLIGLLLGLAPLAAGGWRTDPFSGRFTTAHLLPHIFGFVLFFICSFLPYGSDFKGVWVFLTAPAQAFGGFARGVYAALWIQMIVIPHVIMFLLFAWPWGVWRAGLFAGYSVAVSSIYLALELRLIGSLPFTSQVDATRSAALLPLMIVGGLAMAIAVGLQHLLVFRSPAAVAIVTAAGGAAAYFLTRSSLGAFEGAIRRRLGLLSIETGTFYREIDI